MIGKKIFIVEAGGTTVGFKFGMRAYAIAENSAGKSASELIGGVSKGNVGDMLHVLFGAASSFAESKGLKAPELSGVADIIDEVGLEQFNKLLVEAFSSPENPNVKAPETGLSSSSQ